MNITECSREQEVIAAVMSHRWPDRGDEDLRTHVASCDICRDVAEVAAAFETDHDAERREGHLPSSAHMWWRLQMRARQDAARAAAKPIAVVQSVAAAAAAGLAIAAIGFGWVADAWVPSVSGMGAFVQPAASETLDVLLSVAAATPQTTFVLGAIAAGLVLMPVVVYLALSE